MPIPIGTDTDPGTADTDDADTDDVETDTDDTDTDTDNEADFPWHRGAFCRPARIGLSWTGYVTSMTHMITAPCVEVILSLTTRSNITFSTSFRAHPKKLH